MKSLPALLEQARGDGVVVTLIDSGLKASGDPAAVKRWLPLFRENKPGIVALLSAANDEELGADEAAAVKSPQWLVHYQDRAPVEVFCAPPATYAEVLASRPTAIAAEPLGMHSIAIGARAADPAEAQGANAGRDGNYTKRIERIGK